MAVIQRMEYMQADWLDIIDDYAVQIAKHGADIASLREWARKQPHLPSFTDSQLVLFLELAKHSLEQAKALTDSYMTLRTHHPEMFNNRLQDIQAIKAALDFVRISLPCVKKKNHDGYRLTVVKLIETDASKLDFAMAMKVFMAACDFELARVPFHKGLLVVIDGGAVHLGFLTKINLAVLALTFKYLQLLETKISKVHIINCNAVISQIYSLIRPVMSKYLQDTLYFHSPSEMDQFYEKHLPRSLMPSDYGGELSSLDDADQEFRRRFFDAKEWFEDLDSEKNWVDESKRPSYRRHKTDMIGSFRKLEID